MKLYVDSKKKSIKTSITEMIRLNVDEYKKSDKIPLVIVSDNVRSMNNIGSLFRIADSFRLEKIFLCGISPQPPHNDIHKTALGAEYSVFWDYYDNTETAISRLKSEGYKILSLEQCHGSVTLYDFAPDTTTNKYALVVGNEVHGVSQNIVNMSDICLEIPQIGTKHSLNVSVAAGIAIWHISQNHIKKFMELQS